MVVLKRNGELQIWLETEQLLLELSPAIIARLLCTHCLKPLRGVRLLSLRPFLITKPLCGRSRTGEESRLGFLKVDLVPLREECQRKYLHTLTAAHIDTH